MSRGPQAEKQKTQRRYSIQKDLKQLRYGYTSKVRSLHQYPGPTKVSKLQSSPALLTSPPLYSNALGLELFIEEQCWALFFRKVSMRNQMRCYQGIGEIPWTLQRQGTVIITQASRKNKRGVWGPNLGLTSIEKLIWSQKDRGITQNQLKHTKGCPESKLWGLLKLTGHIVGQALNPVVLQ